MKILQITFGSSIIMLLCVFLWGCTESDAVPVATAVPSGTISPPIPSETFLPSTTSTITSSPTATGVPATSTPTLTATITPTSLPTMTTEERLAFTQELFRTNAGCKLPCWWGITPGATNWMEVETFLRYLGAVSGPNSLDDEFIYHGTGGFQIHSLEGVIDNTIGFLERDGLITMINIRSDGYSNPVAFQEQWANYSPQEVIQAYGVPTRVWLESFAGGPVAEGRVAGYTLWIFYDQLGILILYNGYGEYAPTFHFCPRFENGKDIRSIRIYLQSPNDPNPIDETVAMIGVEIDPYPYVQTIEQAAGIDTTEFYNLFIQEDGQACFDTPRDIWPTE